MEPADQRRDDAATHDARKVSSARAAMEPADQRRDDRRGGHDRAAPQRAAMEPADQRRDDPNSARIWPKVGAGRNGARRPAAGRPAGRGSRRRRVPAAMEPADQRRDD